jgi:hypothetical protein
MQVLQIINQVGPLPINATFKTPVDGPAVFVVTGSLWSQAANALLQMAVTLDGQQIGRAQIWSNGVSTHRAMPALFIGASLTYGEHTLTLTPGKNVISDLNDTFNVSLIY